MLVNLAFEIHCILFSSRMVIAQEQQTSTVELLSGIMGSISTSFAALNATLNPLPES